MTAIFGETKISKIGMTAPQRNPVAQKFHQNRSISHSFRDISIFVFCNFCEKFENSKWPSFLARQIFFEKHDGYSSQISC